MSDQSPRPASAPVRRLGVLRIGDGETHDVIFVQGGPILGLLTHYESKRSHACDGDGCQRCRKGMDLVWKGYASVLHWDRAGKQWWPTALEVTESLELDLRGRVFHSGLWQLSRKAPTKPGRHPPIVGLELQRGPAPLMCPTLDILPAVHWLYHDYTIELTVPSPIPARATVSAIAAPSATEIANPPPKPEERATVKFTDRFKQSSPLTNGIAKNVKGGE